MVGPLPSNASSPTKMYCFGAVICPVLAKMPTAIARSRYAPSFLRSAGERLKV